MKTAAQPVSPQTYSLPQLTSMLGLADLAIQLDAAQRARRSAQYDYHDKIREYEHRFGSLGGRLNPRDESHSSALEYTSEAYRALELAKAQVYNIKRRMDTAVRRINSSKEL